MKKIILLMVLVMGYSAASHADERFEVVCEQYAHWPNSALYDLNKKLEKLKNVESVSHPSLINLPVFMKGDVPHFCVIVKFED